MKNCIIGTAGHVDHGKTMLIKALTGTDTDRLKEEKKRGITIELGFACLELPDGGKAGIVDVPGHEKFVKNMLAGVGSIDLVLMVVAADEGFMPQTREHLDILSMLGMKQGILVLTKTDLVDEEWKEVVKEEIAAEVQGSFLENAPLMEVSSATGEGIEALRRLIFEKLEQADAKNESAPFRIPVDRVFSMEGFGTVITGTLAEGTVREGDEVMIYPEGFPAKVRGLQVHSAAVGKALAGQRVAVNLTGVKKEKVNRGDWIAAPDSMQTTLMLDVRLHALKHGTRELLNASRLHFHHGAGSCLCKLVLLDCDSLAPGGDAYAQLRFTEPVAVKNGDRFVLRFYSPIETVGGGVVLDAQPVRHKRYDAEVLDGLHVKENGTPESKILQKYREEGMKFPMEQQIFEISGIGRDVFDAAVQSCLEQGSLIPVSQKILMNSDVLAQLSAQASELLREYHRQNPLQAGMRREELRSRLLPGHSPALADQVIACMMKRKVLREEKKRLCLPDFAVEYTQAQRQLQKKLETQFLNAGFEPPSQEELEQQYAKQKDAKAVLEALFDEETLIPLTPQIAMHRDLCARAAELVRRHCAQNGNITLAQFRDLIGTSRKYALALLEYFDRQGMTRKTGDVRILRKG